MPVPILNELRRTVETHWLTIQHGRKKRLWLVAFEPTACVHQQREARGVTLRKSVVTESLDLLENAVRERLLVSPRGHAVHDAVVVFFETSLALPGGHRTPKLVGFTSRKACSHHR